MFSLNECANSCKRILPAYSKSEMSKSSLRFSIAVLEITILDSYTIFFPGRFRRLLILRHPASLSHLLSSVRSRASEFRQLTLNISMSPGTGLRTRRLFGHRALYRPKDKHIQPKLYRQKRFFHGTKNSRSPVKLSNVRGGCRSGHPCALLPLHQLARKDFLFLFGEQGIEGLESFRVVHCHEVALRSVVGTL